MYPKSLTVILSFLIVNFLLGCNQQVTQTIDKPEKDKQQGNKPLSGNTSFSSKSEKDTSENTENTLLSPIATPLIKQNISSTSVDNSAPSNPKPIALPQIQTQVIGANPGWNKNLMVDNVAYDLYIPPNYGQNPQLPSILVLPGWNFSRISWVNNSSLVEYAQQYGYALILPEMGKTLYESQYYLQTTMKWNALPGGQFIKQRFIPTIQSKHNLLLPGKHNTMLGLSTGGRGVALIALENPNLFVAGASLSGDFSQENTPQDRLMTAVYGAIGSFPQRWTGRDNPMARVAEWTMPLYLAHGSADNIVPASQTTMFCERLKAFHGNNISLQCDLISGAGHDYQFWSGRLPTVFQFFEQIRP